MKKIDIKSIVTKKDYRNLVYFNSLGRKKYRKYTLVALLIVSLMGIIYSLSVYKGLSLLAGAGAGYVLFVLLSGVMLERNIKRFAKEEDSLIGKEQTITIRDNGIKVCNYIKPEGENYAWKSVLNLYETKKYYYIYMSNGQIIVIGKEYISNYDIENLKALFDEKIAS